MSITEISAGTDRGILVLRFNRFDKRNSITQAMYAELADWFIRAANDPAVRVVVLLGHPEAFCSGNDLSDFLGAPPDSRHGPIGRFMQSMVTCPKPIVAGASGLAVGIGVTLLLHCDLVYCGERTRLQLPFVNLGLCPEFASTLLIPRAAGSARAAEWLLLGEPFSAQDAMAAGLVTRVVPNAEVESQTLEAARKLAELPPNAVRVTKKLLRRWNEGEVLAAIKAEVDDFIPMLRSPEAQEAFAAFAAKRKPDFSRFE